MALDLTELRDYLRMNRADPALVAWVQAELDGGTGMTAAAHDLPSIAYDDCQLVLAGVLQLIATPVAPIEQADVQHFLALCEALGFDDDWIDGFVASQLGITLEALTALAWLRLPTRVTDDQVTAAHRRMAKLYHPDRVTHLAEEFQDLARTRTRQLNRARETLLAVSASAPRPALTDDILIEPDWEDQPTDLDGVTESLEPLPDESA
jgi:hypothetical protein